MPNTLKNIRINELILLVVTFSLSCYLMFSTFSYKNGNMLMASRVWSDFSLTIPLIRSFSLGQNFPPQLPLFAGSPIRYHFIFFLAVATLEKVGLPLDWSLNSLSILAFFALLVSIYFFGKTIFKSKSVGVLAIVLFLFNGSLGFVEFFNKNPLSPNTPTNIITNTEFSSFGPYDGKIVSAFWSLNIYTNQRHLAFSYATYLAFVLIIYKFAQTPKKLSYLKSLVIGIYIGLFPFVHLAVFAMLGLTLAIFFLIYPKLRIKILTIGFLALILAIPQIIYIGKSQIDINFFNPGYLIENLTFSNFIKYWFYNLGFTTVLAPVGFLLANKNQRKISLPFLALFIIGNTFQFSTEIAANHKFFNLFVLGISFFTASFITKLWKKNFLAKLLVPIFLISLTLTGIIDFFPIINDRSMEVKDYPNNPTITYIVQNTPKDAVFLNSSYLYHPASLAGRKIYMGWPYFAWSAGYDTHKRSKKLDEIYTSNNKSEICNLLISENIDYFTTQDTSMDKNFPDIDLAFFENNFVSVYKDSQIEIFDTKLNCTRENPI